MSCEFCENADFGNYRATAGGKYAYAGIALAAGATRYPKDQQFRFCPMCGAPLDEAKALTLEELRERQWIDARKRKPTEMDADAFGDILAVIGDSEITKKVSWRSAVFSDGFQGEHARCWMPLPEPPKGDA